MGVFVRVISIIVFICFSFLLGVNGQDARFSQISSAPLMLNSALTGRSTSGFDLGVLSSFQATNKTRIAHQHIFLHANSDQIKILKGKIDTSSTAPLSKKLNAYWGFGAHYYRYGNDLTNYTISTTPLNGNFYSLSIAKHFSKMNENGENHFFGIGLGLVGANGKLKEGNGLINDSEISGGGFRYRQTALNDAVSDRKYFDLNIGVYYGYRGKSIYFETGAGINHLFHPQIDIFEDSETKLRSRGTIHTSFGVNVSKNFMLVQKNVYWREGFYLRSSKIDSTFKNEIWTGFEFRRRNTRQKKMMFEGGFYTRSMKTLMPYGTILIGQAINIKLSYEWPLSKANYVAYTATRFETAIMFSLGKAFFDKYPNSHNHLRW